GRGGRGRRGGVGGGKAVGLGGGVRRRRLDQRGEVARVYDLAVVRQRTRVQRDRRALHADAQRAVHLLARASRRRGGSSASSSLATTPSGSSSASAIGPRPRRELRPWRRWPDDDEGARDESRGP